MWSNLSDRFFWFAQPPTILTQTDKTLIYVFVGAMALAILIRVITRFSAHEVNKKLLMKLWYLTFTIGMSGVIWGVMRYENTPIFAKRYWAGLNIIIGLIWLLFVLKYLIFNYRTQKSEYDRELVKNKYLPKSR